MKPKTFIGAEKNFRPDGPLKVSLLFRHSHETAYRVLSSVNSALLMASLNTKASPGDGTIGKQRYKKIAHAKTRGSSVMTYLSLVPPIYGQYRSLPPTIPCANPIYFRLFRD